MIFQSQALWPRQWRGAALRRIGANSWWPSWRRKKSHANEPLVEEVGDMVNRDSPTTEVGCNTSETDMPLEDAKEHKAISWTDDCFSFLTVDPAAVVERLGVQNARGFLQAFGIPLLSVGLAIGFVVGVLALGNGYISLPFQLSLTQEVQEFQSVVAKQEVGSVTNNEISQDRSELWRYERLRKALSHSSDYIKGMQVNVQDLPTGAIATITDMVAQLSSILEKDEKDIRGVLFESLDKLDKLSLGIFASASGLILGNSVASLALLSLLVTLPVAQARREANVNNENTARPQGLVSSIRRFFDQIRGKKPELDELVSNIRRFFDRIRGKEPELDEQPEIKRLAPDDAYWASSGINPARLDAIGFTPTRSRRPPPLAVGAEIVTGEELAKVGLALRIYCRWEDQGVCEEWIPLLAVVVGGPVQASVVRLLWGMRRFEFSRSMLIDIVARSVNRRVAKKGWKQLYSAARNGSRSLGFGFEVLASRGIDEHFDAKGREIISIPAKSVR